MATSQDFFNWVCGDQLVPEFLAYLLRGSRGYIRSLASGAVHGTVYMPTAAAFWVCVPVPAIQQTIVSVLSDQLAAVERARAPAEIRLEAAQRLAAAHLRVAFGSAATRDWPCRPLRDLAEIVSGITLGRKPPTDPVRPVAYLRVANVKDGYLALDDVYSIEASDSEIEKLRLRRGDLLLTEGGDPDKLGRGTFWEEQIQECIHQNHIFRVRFETAMVLPEFAAAQVGSQYGKRYFLKYAKQTTGIATINQRVLGEFPFLLPPPEQQQAIIDRLRLELAAAKQVRAAAEAELAAVKALPATLLRRAFSGEL
jgi:type I restriction enzyme S subunit